MRNKTTAESAAPPAGPRPLRGAAHRVGRGGRARAPAAGLHGHDHRVAVEGPGRDARPRRAAGRARATTSCRTSPPGWCPGAASSPRSARRLVALGVRTIFVPAGDADPPAGDYHAVAGPARGPRPSSAARSRTSASPATRVAPVDPRRPDRAGHVGQAPARHAGGQQPDLRPGDRCRPGCAGCAGAGITMPLLVGVPGPVDRTKLLLMATKIGVGESTKFLAKHRRTLTRLAAPGGFTGERFLEKLAPAPGRAGRARRGPARVHVQPGGRDRAVAPRPAAPARRPRSTRR